MAVAEEATRLSARRPLARASDFISHYATSDYPTVLYARASTREQDKNGNLLDQVMNAYRTLTALGERPIAVFDDVETSNINGSRPTLEKAIAYAKERGAILVIASRDRLIRHRGFGRGQKAKVEPPNATEYKWLTELLDGCPIASIEHPDATPSDVRSGQTLRGLADKGGRRSKRDELLPRIQALLDGGLSKRAIGRELGIAEATIRHWLKETTAMGHVRFWCECGNQRSSKLDKCKACIRGIRAILSTLVGKPLDGDEIPTVRRGAAIGNVVARPTRKSVRRDYTVREHPPEWYLPEDPPQECPFDVPVAPTVSEDMAKFLAFEDDEGKLSSMPSQLLEQDELSREFRSIMRNNSS